MSSNSDSVDVLVELSDDEIEEYRKYYKSLEDLEFVHVHLYLKNQLRWNRLMKRMSENEVSQLSDRCKMKFYRHRHGKWENQTLIGITGDKEYSVFFASLDESIGEIRECLAMTNMIEWNKLPLFVAIHRRFHEMLYEIFETKNLRVRTDNFCSTLWMDKDMALTFEFSVPDDVEMKKLTEDNHQMINDIWLYKYPGSDCFINSLIKLNSTLGVYHNEKLVSWILQVECFGLGLLQTIESHQGKGYARLLTRAMTRKISEDHDEDTILFASYGKPQTVDLYIRYGFKHVSYTHWIYLKHA